MITKLLTFTIFTFAVVTIIQSVTKASRTIYLEAQTTMTVPHARAQLLYDEANN